MDNFRIYVDRGGKMPQLRRRAWECASHPYYVRYVGGRPVAFHGPMDVVAARSPVDRQLKFFDYATKTFVAASTVLAE